MYMHGVNMVAMKSKVTFAVLNILFTIFYLLIIQNTPVRIFKLKTSKKNWRCVSCDNKKQIMR